ncbi:MAG: hypothetical protein ACI8XO_004155 [Verrucomicrobiales bacterium]|jgi:hypothetical protein
MNGRKDHSFRISSNSFDISAWIHHHKPMKSLLSPLHCATLVIAIGLGSTQAATTVFHYRVNDTDAAGLPNIPSVGGSDGTAQGTFSGIFSTDVPTAGVPASAGNRSIVGAGDALSDGVNSPSNQELSNAAVIAAGGYTLEAWFKWNGGGNVNAIIDYAGTDKFRMIAGTGILDINFDSGSGAQPIASPSIGDWHYAAAVFTHDGGGVSGTGGIGGTVTWYFDGNTALGTAAAIKDDFGDSLNRPIGVGRHPLGFGGDDFDGLIYEPRVSLGALSSSELLFVPEPGTGALACIGAVLLFLRRRRN